MRRLSSGLLLPLVAASALAGCASMQTSTNKMVSAFKSVSEKSPADEPSDPWINETGSYTSSIHPSEPVNDPLGLRNVFMSQRARDIERNLGVGE